MKFKTNYDFAKWDGLNILFFIQYIRCFKNFWGSENVLLQLSLKMIKKWRKLWVQHILWSSKILFCLLIEAYFFSNGHICNVVSMFPSVVKIDVENNNVVLTLSNVVQFTVEKHNVVSTLFNVINFNVDVHNVVSTFIWRCATLRRHINLKTMLNQRWNVCWEHENLKHHNWQLHKWINNVILYRNEKGRKRKEILISKKGIV